MRKAVALTGKIGLVCQVVSQVINAAVLKQIKTAASGTYNKIRALLLIWRKPWSDIRLANVL